VIVPVLPSLAVADAIFTTDPVVTSPATTVYRLDPDLEHEVTALGGKTVALPQVKDAKWSSKMVKGEYKVVLPVLVRV